MAPLLESIVTNAPCACAGDNGAPMRPLFFLIGAAPCKMPPVGMQSMTYFISGSGSIEFWWVKPDSNGAVYDPAYLTLNTGGACKNACGGAAKAGFQPIADNFAKSVTKDGVSFGTEAVSPDVLRAFFDAGGGRCYVCAIWQEEWSGPMAWTKFMQGRIMFQKDPLQPTFHTLPFRVEGTNLCISRNPADERGPYGPELMPSDAIKDDCVIR